MKNDDHLIVQVEKKNISFVKWIIEGSEYLGVVTTLDEKENILFIRSTPDMLDDVKKMLINFDFPVKLINA